MGVKLHILKTFLILVLINDSVSRSHSKLTLPQSLQEVDNVSSYSTIPVPVQYSVKTNSLNSYLNSSVNAVKRVVNALPNPKQILNYGKQALIGIPEELASGTKRFLCSKMTLINEIQKEYHPDLDDVYYSFLTQDRDNVTISLLNSESLFNHPKFHMNWKVVLFVTGWNVNESNETVSALYEAYRCRSEHNFVVLDTSKFISSMYAWSEFSTEPIGELIAGAIANLTRFVPYERIHLIGNGIGAHIAGFAGRHFRKLTGKALSRVTGLDPSRACFSESDRSNGLQRGDALFVDIIHSKTGWLGLDPIGDVDIYPNGPNIIQNGCWSASCSKNRAYQFYAKTVYPGNEFLFNVTKCDSVSLFKVESCKSANNEIPLGILTPNWARGKFYLTSSILQEEHKKHCNDK